MAKKQINYTNHLVEIINIELERVVKTGRITEGAGESVTIEFHELGKWRLPRELLSLPRKQPVKVMLRVIEPERPLGANAKLREARKPAERSERRSKGGG